MDELNNIRVQLVDLYNRAAIISIHTDSRYISKVNEIADYLDQLNYFIKYKKYQDLMQVQQ